jgi:hypothetical protein
VKTGVDAPSYSGGFAALLVVLWLVFLNFSFQLSAFLL